MRLAPLPVQRRQRLHQRQAIPLALEILHARHHAAGLQAGERARFLNQQREALLLCSRFPRGGGEPALLLLLFVREGRERRFESKPLGREARLRILVWCRLRRGRRRPPKLVAGGVQQRPQPPLVLPQTLPGVLQLA